ncbi:cytidine deaminase [Sediminibacterium sp. WSJ-3]|nr:cytidine deaminase [Sediminibacterium soli]NCI47092.1 cytidine deaminase [Sediminibacterium soli]
MEQQRYQFEYSVYDSIDELSQEDAALLREAQQATHTAYAPYSQFQVGAAAKLVNGKVLCGSNQENASYPVGLCAERVLLSAASSVYPNVPIETIAISYDSGQGNSDRPISPCGICRQTLVEYEKHLGQPIRLVLGGIKGKVFVIPGSTLLLPFGFSSEDMEKG